MFAPMPPTARAYVLETWRRSLPRGRRTYSHAEANRVRERMVDDHAVNVAIGPDGETVIGWVCFTRLRSTSVIHYVYVRAAYRGGDVARELIESTGADISRPIPVTHCTARIVAAAGRASITLREIPIAEVLA